MLVMSLQLVSLHPKGVSIDKKDLSQYSVMCLGFVLECFNTNDDLSAIKTPHARSKRLILVHLCCFYLTIFTSWLS